MKNFYSKLLFIGALALSFYTNHANAQVYAIGSGQTATDVTDDGNIITLNTSEANFFWSKDEGIQVLNEMPENVYNVGSPKVSKDGSLIAASVANPATDIVEMGLYNLATVTWQYLGSFGQHLDKVAGSVWDFQPDGSKVVGLIQSKDNNAHAAVWTKEEGLVDSGSTVEERFSRINAVSNDGKIYVGWQDGEDGNRQAAYWEDNKQTIVKGPNDEFVTEFSGVSGDGKWMIGAFGFSASKWSKERSNYN